MRILWRQVLRKRPAKYQFEIGIVRKSFEVSYQSAGSREILRRGHAYLPSEPIAMPSSQRTTFVDRVRRAAFLREAAQLTDGELLECYATHRDEAAFEALVRRHGPMVLGVCRRLLQNPHDAEDAFQATFLVLVRKAAAIAPREKVGSWLY